MVYLHQRDIIHRDLKSSNGKNVVASVKFVGMPQAVAVVGDVGSHGLKMSGWVQILCELHKGLRFEC